LSCGNYQTFHLSQSAKIELELKKHKSKLKC